MREAKEMAVRQTDKQRRGQAELNGPSAERQAGQKGRKNCQAAKRRRRKKEGSQI